MIQKSRLVLGTAQLGMQYGIANKTGQPDIKTAEAIVKEAWEGGICEFDTAQGYGESEKVLGRVLKRLGIKEQVRIISKLNPYLNHIFPSELRPSLEKSLGNIGISKLYGLMLHKEELIQQWNDGLGEALSQCVDAGFVENIGISVYSPNKAIEALRNDDITLIQIPSNILDRRFEKAGVFKLAESNSKQIYVRSIFLQGLLLMDSKILPKSMTYASKTLKKFESFADSKGITRQKLALGYVKQTYQNAKIIFGAETVDQVKKNIQDWSNSLSQSILTEAREIFNDIDEKILNPSLWPE